MLCEPGGGVYLGARPQEEVAARGTSRVPAGKTWSLQAVSKGETCMCVCFYMETMGRELGCWGTRSVQNSALCVRVCEYLLVQSVPVPGGGLQAWGLLCPYASIQGDWDPEAAAG